MSEGADRNRRPRGGGLLAACMGRSSASAGSQPLSKSLTGASAAAAYGAGGGGERSQQDIVAALTPAVKALNDAAASLKDDMKREQAANEEFREGLAREQRHMQRRLESFEGRGGGAGRRSVGRGSGSKAHASDDAAAAMARGRGVVWSSSTCASILAVVVCVVAFIMYASSSASATYEDTSAAAVADDVPRRLRAYISDSIKFAFRVHQLVGGFDTRCFEAFGWVMQASHALDEEEERAKVTAAKTASLGKPSNRGISNGARLSS